MENYEMFLILYITSFYTHAVYPYTTASIFGKVMNSSIACPIHV